MRFQIEVAVVSYEKERFLMRQHASHESSPEWLHISTDSVPQ